MKSSSARPSATSLPRSPEDDAGSRSTRYLVMMGIRILCFILMAVITPYGWYTWVFAAGAVFLPYVAVVLANNGEDHRPVPESPERALPSAPSTPVRPTSAPGATVIRIQESPSVEPPRPAAAADVRDSDAA